MSESSHRQSVAQDEPAILVQQPTDPTHHHVVSGISPQDDAEGQSCYGQYMEQTTSIVAQETVPMALINTEDSAVSSGQPFLGHLTDDAVSHAMPVNTAANPNLGGITELIHSESLGDYAALPDLTFPFTSFAFTGSAETPPTGGVQPWFGDDSTNLNIFNATPAAAIGALDTSAAAEISPQTSLNQDSHETPKSWPSFTVSPPLLSDTQKETLLDFFESEIRPPASLVGVDPLGWSQIRTRVLRMAREKRESVLHAIYTLSTLLSASNTTFRLGISRDDHILFASRLHEAACAAMHVGISHPAWETKRCQELLICVFLLAWFEVCIGTAASSHCDESVVVHFTDYLKLCIGCLR